MVIIKNAIENIKTNKLKVMVAMVWIVLGITSVVVVSSIGNGIERQGQANLNNPKYRTHKIVYSPNYSGGVKGDFFEPFTQYDIDSLASMRGIERVTPVFGQTSSLSYGGGLSVGDEMEFVEFDILDKPKSLDLEFGRSFSINDLDRKTIVLEYETASLLFGDDIESAIGKPVIVEGENFEVIGITKPPKEGLIDVEETYRQAKAYVPKNAIDELAKVQNFGQPISELEILVEKGYDADGIPFEATKMLNNLKTDKDGEYTVSGEGNDSFELGHMQSTLNRATSVLSTVSLLIGGIGIMNIMYMSVSERQREIGIRRAIGAEPKDIMIQFLIETILITVIGGFIGSIVGTLAAGNAAGYLGVEAIPTVGVYVKAIVVSILIGAVFGSIPAYKASNLDPIKAIQG